MATRTPAPATNKNSVTQAGKTVYLTNKEMLAELKRCKKKGQMSDMLAKMLQLLCSRYAKKGNFINYCVDEQTETLTQRGWVTHKEISTNDIILSYNVDTSQLTWSPIFDVYRNSFNGKMHSLCTEGLDALVTPNHKFVSKERGIIPVEDIICKEHIILMGAPVQSPVETWSTVQVELIGWAITEGHYSTKSKTRHSIRISQKLGNKADRIRSVIIECGIRFREYVQNGIVSFHCTGSLVSTVHSTLAPNRVLSPEFILSLTQHQRKLLINTMVSGDGWIRPSGGQSYGQKCEKHTDAFLMLVTLAGETSFKYRKISRTPKSGGKPEGGISDGFGVNIYASPKLQCKAESIDFNGGKPGAGGMRANRPNFPTVDYDGIVWCPQTLYGTFVCRRNGYTYVTGNSYNEDMQGYAMMMLVRTWNSFDPEKSSNPFAFFTQCIKNSFIQYLNHERRQRDVRDLMLIDQGLNPSYGYDDGRERGGIQDENEFETIVNTAEAVTKTTKYSDAPIERDDKGAEIEAIEFTEDDVIDDIVE